MRVIKHLKYKLLMWLLNDICDKSVCGKGKCKIYFCNDCMRHKISSQARKVYEIGENEW